MLVFWLLSMTVFVPTLARKCSLHFYPSSICHHYDYTKGCVPGFEQDCEPVKTTYQNPRCPTYICVSLSLKLSLSCQDTFISNVICQNVEAPFLSLQWRCPVCSVSLQLPLSTDMCKSRVNHCLCCLDFIVELDFIQCSKANCQRTIVYPKIFEECKKCLKACSNTRCNQEVKGLPRYWFTKPNLRPVRFERAAPNRLLLTNAHIGKGHLLAN